MNISQLKSQIQTLGFEDKETMSDGTYADIIINGINRAIQMIALEVMPNFSEFSFSLDDEAVRRIGNEVIYDVKESDDYQHGRFWGVHEVKCLYSGKIVHDVDFEFRMSRLTVPYMPDAEYTVVYKTIPRTITADTPAEEEIDLDVGVHLLVAPLAAYYIWLDDDERKAQMCRNDYEDLKNVFLGQEKSDNIALERIYEV